MNWPATMDALEDEGYGYTGTSKTCECGTTILWFVTPNKKWMPLSSIKDSRLVPHHSVCDRIKQFRKAGKKPKPEAPKQKDLF
ncbi:MAG TPA: hypothetical protein VNE63_22170 [Candidatus Acidoferrales bacterium]|nr:hypothetical protein [Candidatus Acidoferrales bacterium]